MHDISLSLCFTFSTERLLDKKKKRKKNAAFERRAKKVNVVSFLASCGKRTILISSYEVCMHVLK